MIDHIRIFGVAIVLASIVPWIPLGLGQDNAARIIEFSVENGSIDGDQFVQTILARMHWTTELTTKLLGEFSNSESTKFDVTTGRRIPIETLSILCQVSPSAFYWKSASDPDRNVPFHPLDKPTTFPSVLCVDLNALDSQWNAQKLSLRQRLAEAEAKPIYEVCNRMGFDDTDRIARQAVMVLAGLHGDVKSAIGMAEAIHRRTGIPTCAFRYPNDAPLAESADYLREKLRAWHSEAPARHICLVTHSMSGLIVRSVIESANGGAFDELGIHQLIQICPPNHGSIWAEYAPFLEGFDQAYQWLGRGEKASLFSSIIDGLNEAPNDLVPTSTYLSELNKAPRNPNVKYSILAGNAGLTDPIVTSLASDLLDLFASPSNRSNPIETRMRALLKSPELQRRSGDGVVSLVSARLNGVSDFEILPVNHLDWSRLSETQGELILNEVIERIENYNVLQRR